MSMKPNDILFAEWVLTSAKYRAKIGDAVKGAMRCGYDNTHGKFHKLHFSYIESATVWLAKYYQPVYERFLDGASFDECIELWGKTKAVKQSRLQHPTRAKSNKELAISATSRAAWAQGWRANHDWNVCK